MTAVLVTGGAGYIGSHACVALLAGGWDVVVVDDLSNSHPLALERVREIAGGGGSRLLFHHLDLNDRPSLEQVFARHAPAAVLHFAGWKAVGESVERPLAYYRNNLGGTIALLEVMARWGTKRLVFSSSCTVYGDGAPPPVDETAPLSPRSPYGSTKLAVEQLLRDVAAADQEWSVALLRYFNPVGAHPSGRIGEDPRGTPNNLMPFIMQVAAGRRPELQVFGGDYPTRDGTCIRDYIHVEDLAAGHLGALRALERTRGCRAYNLGTGHGTTVLEVIRAAQAAVGRPIPYRVTARRAGDVVAVWADPSLAERELGFRAQRDIAAMCADHWRWQAANPGGYAGAEAAGQSPGAIGVP